MVIMSMWVGVGVGGCIAGERDSSTGSGRCLCGSAEDAGGGGGKGQTYSRTDGLAPVRGGYVFAGRDVRVLS